MFPFFFFVVLFFHWILIKTAFIKYSVLDYTASSTHEDYFVLSFSNIQSNLNKNQNFGEKNQLKIFLWYRISNEKTYKLSSPFGCRMLCILHTGFNSLTLLKFLCMNAVCNCANDVSCKLMRENLNINSCNATKTKTFPIQLKMKIFFFSCGRRQKPKIFYYFYVYLPRDS